MRTHLTAYAPTPRVRSNVTDPGGQGTGDAASDTSPAVAVKDREPTMEHCGYCALDGRLAAVVHCSACGHRVVLAEPFSASGRCDACIRWATGRREVIADREIVASLYAAIAERARSDCRAVEAGTLRSRYFGETCEVCGAPTEECAGEYLTGLADIVTTGGDWLEALLVAADVATTSGARAA